MSNAVLNFRIDKKSKEQLEEIAKREDLSVSHIIRKGIREILKKADKRG